MFNNLTICKEHRVVDQRTTNRLKTVARCLIAVIVLLGVTLDGNGTSTLTSVVSNPALSGITMELLAFTVNESGQAVATNTEGIALQ